MMLFPTRFYYGLFFAREAELRLSNSALQKAYAEIQTQQALFKRRIAAIHEMTEQCNTLPEWRLTCENVFKYQLNSTTVAIWLAEDIALKSETAWPAHLAIDDEKAYALLSKIGCMSWKSRDISVLLPLVATTGVTAVIGLASDEALTSDDLDFAVIVGKELQKALQFIKATETMKNLNLSEFTQKNESLFREMGITSRELEIIGMVVQGMSNAQISTKIFVSESTTKRHIYNLFKKLGITSRFELLGWMNDRALESTM